MRHEALTLAEVFGLPTPELPLVVVVGKRDAVRTALRIVQSAPIVDTGFILADRDFDTKRRTYAELEGTPGYPLLVPAAGTTNGGPAAG